MTAFADRNARAGWLGVDHGAEQLKEANMNMLTDGKAMVKIIFGSCGRGRFPSAAGTK